MNARGGLFFLPIWLQASQNIFLKVLEWLHLNSSDRCYWQCLTLSTQVNPAQYIYKPPLNHQHIPIVQIHHYFGIGLWSHWVTHADLFIFHKIRLSITQVGQRCHSGDVKLRVQASSKVSATVCMLLNSDDTRQITMIWVDEDVWLL